MVMTSVLDVRVHLSPSPEEEFSVAGDIPTEMYELTLTECQNGGPRNNGPCFFSLQC